ncbi:hypothetical protein [Thermospira aquatica]|uniref:Ribonuclease n=1 Tax=Thermospira aquatica TaxID=2828656 RepID=A0AAX3BF41_9SPIR|nr:hypothetical protein [Thermospira aquatica]URA10957.1 hypothetical protein KDW03_03900 [Thermospira aquatica]
MATHALQFPLEKEKNLRDALEEKGYTFRPLQYGFWQASHNGIVLSFYNSGRLVIQGSEEKIQGFLPFLSSWMSESLSQLGCDECGKGEVFGPLVLVAVGVPKENFSQLQMLGITESKKASEKQLHQWYDQILSLCQVETFILEPEAYNQLYENYPNVNTILTLGYKDLLKRFKSSWDEVIVDAYAQDKHTQHTLSSVAPGKFLFETGAEKYPAVGAASLVAKKIFLNWFTQQPLKLPRGSGPEARELFFHMKSSNPAELKRYAKIHFFSKKEAF